MEKEETKSRRQLLEEAWDKSEESEDGGVGAVRAEVAEGADEPKQEEQETEQRADESGVEEKSAPAKKDGKTVDKAVEQELKASKRLETGKQQPVQLEPTDRAPGSWKPAIRELWSQIPKEARDEIRQRELHLEQTLTQTATMRKFATDFANMVSPYQHLIRSQGSTPLQAVNNLMQTAAGLAGGNPQQRAEIVAQIMSNYGVDVQLLDKILTQTYNPQTAQYNQQQNSAPPPWAQPIFAWMQRAENQQQQYEAQQRAQAEIEIKAMEAEPFFEDLRDDIADIMEISANRGRIISMKEAYQKAVQLNPEISKLVAKSKPAVQQQNSVSQAAATLARARKAAKTISGAPRSEGKGSDKPKSRRDMLSEAWDEQQSA